MKKIYNLLIFVILLTLISCSDNTVAPPSTGNPPVTNDSLLFSKDSASIYLPPNTIGSQTFSFVRPDTITSYNFYVRIQFTAQGYTDSGYVSYSALTTSYPSGPDSTLHFLSAPFNHDFNYTVDLVPTCNLKFDISANGTMFGYPAWIKLKNIRIYKSNN